MKEFSYIITISVGIHGLPAWQLARAAKACSSRIIVYKGKHSAPATKPIALMQLFAKTGDRVIVRIVGTNEEQDAVKMQEYFKTNL